MRLGTAPSPSATPALQRVIVSLNRETVLGDRYSDHDAGFVRADFGADSVGVEAYRDVYDPLWDGPVAEPADPRDWHLARVAQPSGLLGASVRALGDVVRGMDLATMSRGDQGSHGYAAIGLTFAERPEGVDHLTPRQEPDGGWTVSFQTSLDDLLAEPRLAPLVQAAEVVLAAARPPRAKPGPTSLPPRSA